MSADAVSRLMLIRAEPKFVDEPGTIYNGMRPEALRQAAEANLNELIDALAKDPSAFTTNAVLHRSFRKALASFPGPDTEDRERMVRYLQRICELVAVDPPRFLLARWLYGPLGGILVLMSHGTGSRR